jgi:hypothetical protein
MRNTRWRLLGLLSLLATAGCKGGPAPCTTFIGSPQQPIEGTLITVDKNGALVDVAAGDAVLLQPPPQGGYVVYAGARARNLKACNVDFQGQLIDMATGGLAGFDRRQANLVAGPDGWGRPDGSQFANLANVNPCPDPSPNDVQGRTLLLQMQLTDQDGRTLKLSTPVVPQCQLDDPGVQANCVCTCSANYSLGKCGFPDGGAGDGG